MPSNEPLYIVTATLDRERAQPFIDSWQDTAAGPVEVLVMEGVKGVIPAFAAGLANLEAYHNSTVCLFHDDLLIEQYGWDLLVRKAFEDPTVMLAGFGGALGLGASDIYQIPYDPMQLARQDFISNMRDAEAHGRRELRPKQVACLDGFSQIASWGFLERAFAWFTTWGMVHHAYDAALGCFANRIGKVMYLPVACHHHGGLTAVANQDYHAWAKEQTEGGDMGFWEHSHRVVYEKFKDVLPIRIG